MKPHREAERDPYGGRVPWWRKATPAPVAAAYSCGSASAERPHWSKLYSRKPWWLKETPKPVADAYRAGHDSTSREVAVAWRAVANQAGARSALNARQAPSSADASSAPIVRATPREHRPTRRSSRNSARAGPDDSSGEEPEPPRRRPFEANYELRVLLWRRFRQQAAMLAAEKKRDAQLRLEDAAGAQPLAHRDSIGPTSSTRRRRSSRATARASRCASSSTGWSPPR